MNIVFILRFYFVFFPKILWFSNEDLYMAVRTFLIICKRFNVVLNRAFIWAIETNPITFPSSQQYSKSINQCKLSNTSIPAVAFKKMLYIYIMNLLIALLSSRKALLFSQLQNVTRGKTLERATRAPNHKAKSIIIC